MGVFHRNPITDEERAKKKKELKTRLAVFKLSGRSMASLSFKEMSELRDNEWEAYGDQSNTSVFRDRFKS